MENPFWESTKEWFSEQGVWLIVTLVVAVLFYMALRILAPRIVRTILLRADFAGQGEKREKLLHTVTRWVVWVGTVAVIAALIFALLPRFGVDISPTAESVADWLVSHGLRIVLIMVLAYVANRLQRVLVHKAVEHGGVRGTKRVQEEFKQRVDTLSGFLSQIAAAAIWLMAAFMALSEMGINVAPLLAGAGIIGLAIGFGAQTLVQDIISGLFIIIENQYHKGDWIMIAGISGSVEEVNMRRTVLRDLDGTIHVVPNGEVRAASNYTREYGRVNLDISVGYGEDLDRAIDVINRVGREMAAEEYWAKAVAEPPHVLRVNNLGDSGIDIKVYGKTKRVRQWEVMGELRKRIKTTFDEEGIEIPWPHTKVFFGNALEQRAGVEKKPSPPKAPAREVKEPGPSAKGSRKKARERTIPTSEDEMEAEGDGG